MEHTSNSTQKAYISLSDAIVELEEESIEQGKDKNCPTLSSGTYSVILHPTRSQDKSRGEELTQNALKVVERYGIAKKAPY